MEAVDALMSGPDRRFEAGDLFDVMDHAERYNRHLLELVLAATGTANTVLDFGAGTGRLATSLAERGFDVTCVEPDPELRARLIDRGLASVAALTDLGARRFDCAVSLNVLEHIPDDARIARALHERLVPGGPCVIYVPAFPLLWTANDTRVGHQRRYRRSELIRVFQDAGFAIEDVRYVDSLGFLAALAYRVIDRSDGELSARSVQIYDRLLFPLSRVLDHALHRVAGKNLLLRARRR